jgi:hypothetical protein
MLNLISTQEWEQSRNDRKIAVGEGEGGVLRYLTADTHSLDDFEPPIFRVIDMWPHLLDNEHLFSVL